MKPPPPHPILPFKQNIPFSLCFDWILSYPWIFSQLAYFHDFTSVSINLPPLKFHGVTGCWDLNPWPVLWIWIRSDPELFGFSNIKTCLLICLHIHAWKWTYLSLIAYPTYFKVLTAFFQIWFQLPCVRRWSSQTCRRRLPTPNENNVCSLQYFSLFIIKFEDLF